MAGFLRARARARARSLLLGPLLGAVAACGGGDVRPPLPSPELVPELVGAEEALDRSRGDDYWAERFGDHLSAEELEAYRRTPPRERFAEFGRRLLRIRLCEDLLQEHRWRLTREQVEEYRSQPDYESSRAYLERVLESDAAAAQAAGEEPAESP